MLNFFYVVFSFAFIWIVIDLAVTKDEQPRRLNGQYDFKPKKVSLKGQYPSEVFGGLR